MKQVKVIRVLEYIGPADWIEAILAKNYITKAGIIFSENPQKQIRELLQVIEELPK